MQRELKMTEPKLIPNTVLHKQNFKNRFLEEMAKNGNVALFEENVLSRRL